MRLIAVIFLSVFLSKSCAQKQEIGTAVVEYTANTRGFFEKIVIQKQTILISKDRNGNDHPLAQKISDADWAILIKDFRQINLGNLSSLKAPTQKRLYDGAAIANLRITYKDSVYESAGFDHGYPPVEIAAFVDKIVSFEKK